MMRVDDFIVLGRTVPERSKRYGQRVCMAGYSEELRQLMRIYPLKIRSNIKCRCLLAVELERNRMDSRIESWALKDRTEQSIIGIRPQVEKTRLQALLEDQVVKSIEHLNDNCASLGIIKPSNFEVILRRRKHVEDPHQLALFDEFCEQGGFKTASDYFFAPYVRIYSNDKQQCLQLREWGIYELMRKYEADGKNLSANEICNALRINQDSDVYFVIGNMNHVRNVWLVIKAFVFKKNGSQQGLFTPCR